MALGTVITLDMNFTGAGVSTLPKIITRDFMEAPGSLILLETKHPLYPLPNGVPTHGATYTNIFAENAAKLGLGDTSLSAQSVYASPGHGKVERTAKGGIHVIQSITQDMQHAGFQLRLPESLATYFKANPTHQFYISQWGKTTRPETATQHSVSAMSGNQPSSFAWTLADNNSPGAGPTNLGTRAVVAEVAGKTNFRNVGVTNFHQDFLDATIPPQAAALFEVGNFLVPNGGVGKRGFHGAQVFYRGYIEDMTVSGRTYEQVDALDLAEYTKQVLTAGGRYYNDTEPTNPATIP